MSHDLRSRIAALSPERRRLLARARGEGDAPQALSRRRADASAPLTSAQAQLWFLEKLAPGRLDYLVCACLTLDGPLELGALQVAFARLVQRHAALRTRFLETCDGPRQLPCPAADVKLIADDEPALPQEAFDLVKGPLWRVHLQRLAPDRHLLTVAFHHLICDGWSLSVLIQELAQLYVSALTGSESPLASPLIQYADYAVWQYEQVRSGQLSDSARRRAQALGTPPQLPLPRPRPESQVLRGARHPLHISTDAVAAIDRLAEWSGTTRFGVLLTAWAMLLGRNTGAREIWIGVPAANRDRAALHSVVGLFANMVVVRARPGRDFDATLPRVHAELVEALGHQSIPFERLVDQMRPERAGSHTPLIRTAAALQDPLPNLSMGDLRVRVEPLYTGFTTLDLMLVARPHENGLDIDLEYAEAVFDAAEIEAWANDLTRILREISRPTCTNLTPTQLAMWLGEQTVPTTPTYHQLLVCELAGQLDPIRLEHALQGSVDECDALRTVLEIRDGVPRQTWRKPGSVTVPTRYIDCSGRAGADIADLIDAHGTAPFADGNPLLRSLLIRKSRDELLWILCLHHLITDAWSFSLLLRYTSEQYLDLRPRRRASFVEHIAKEASRAESPAFKRGRQWWQTQLEPAPPRPRFFGRERNPVSTAVLRRQTIIGRSLESLASRPEIADLTQALSFGHLFAAMLGVLVWRLSGERDICLGLPLHNRGTRIAKEVVGACMLVAPLRFSVEPKRSLIALAESIRDRTRDLIRHAASAPPSQRPYDVLLNNQSVELIPDPFGCRLTDAAMHNAGHAIDSLALHIEPDQAGWRLTLEANAEVFGEEGADLGLALLRALADDALSSPDQAVSALGRDVICRHRSRVTESGPATYVSIWQRIEQVADAHPDVIAIQDGSANLTYGTLVRRAQGWAAAIRSAGFGRGARIAIAATRTFTMLEQVLGTLAAGAAFVPVDPWGPEQDRAVRLGSADCSIDTLNTCETAMICPPPDPRDPVYVMHTSGTTGRSRAVLLTHAGLANHVNWAIKAFALESGDRVLQFASLCFDTALEEIFPTLLAGATLVLRDQAMLESPKRFWSLCSELGVTVADLPTAFWHIAAGDQRARKLHDSIIRLVVLGGEAVSHRIAERWLGDEAPPLLNTYGPTEATVVSAALPITAPDAPIGQPITGTSAYVLDEDAHPVVSGVHGELYLGGIGIAIGYLGDPARTADRFLPDPHAAIAGARMYRTGDRARLRQDGDLEFLGRIDRQVKVRGIRVEPEWVESFLLGHPEIREVAITSREATGGNLLVAHYLGDAEPETIRAWASGQLIEPMMPRFDKLTSMPRTQSGKPDLQSLAGRRLSSDRGQARSETDPSVSAATRDLLEIWRELLERSPGSIDVDDDFFDVGGHSLLATMLLARIEKAFRVRVPLQRFLDNPTILALARFLETAPETSRLPPLERIARHARTPVSFAQSRLWFLDRLDPGNPTWNVPLAVEIEGELDASRLVAALNAVVRRHEALRTLFADTPNGPITLVQDELPPAASIEDLSQVAELERKDIVSARIQRLSNYRFDLTKGPLVRLDLLRIQANRHLFILCCHHIICDGWSLGILVDELRSLYQGGAGTESLAPLPIQYADYAMWQRGLESFWEPHLAWWLDQLAGAPDPTSLLPLDNDRPAVARHHGATLTFSVPAPVAARLGEIGRSHGATNYMVLLTAFATLLSRWAGVKDLVVGTPVAGRDTPETEPLIGFFVNTLALRIDLTGDPPFLQQLRRVRDHCNSAQAHRYVPFERVVEGLAPERSSSSQPLFAAMFTFLNEPTRKATSQLPLRWSPLDIDRGYANRDLTLRMEPHAEGLRGWFEYDVDLFRRDTMEGLCERFGVLLDLVATAPATRLSLLDLRTRSDREAEACLKMSRRNRFLSILQRPRSSFTDVSESPMDAARPSPRVFEAPVEELDAIAWVNAHRDRVEAAFRDEGAILFRGFTLADPVDLARFSRVFCSELMPYEEASTPRTKLVEGVYTSTEYPADQLIMAHSEMAYAGRWPRRIWFYCAKPATKGGATPVVCLADLYNALDPPLRDRFEASGVLYLRNFGVGIDLSWQQTFGTDDPEAVQSLLRASGVEYEWRSKGGLRTRRRGPAVCRHPDTGEKVWFNSAHMFHVSSLPTEIQEALRIILAPDDLPRNAFYGDGEVIPDDVIARIRQHCEQLFRRFRWREGDLLMLDNMRWAHGRDPFTGPREVWVAMASPWSLE